MRAKKQKRHRRALRFYAACYGFREPFKIICDGTFVHHLHKNKITLSDALVNTLGARVSLFITSCALEEIKSLGADYSELVDVASTPLTARCKHKQRKSAVSCLVEVTGENNREHFFVATQDADLRKELQQMPGVPVIYALRNAIFLEPPSAAQREFANAAEESRSHMTQAEFELLRNQSQGQAESRKRKFPDGGAVQFKRKKAKGPNPLSMLKKKKKPVEQVQKNDDGTAKKKRKRSRKGKGKGKRQDGRERITVEYWTGKEWKTKVKLLERKDKSIGEEESR